MSGTTDRRRNDSNGRELRIAAVGDTHFDGSNPGSLRELFAEIERSADILVICGDLTTHGRPDEMRALIEEMAGIHIPMVCVFGNHDYEGEVTDELKAMLRARGVHVLDGDHVVIEGIGFAGTKGFAGGFGRGALAPFGERLIKDFVQAAIDEAIKLENALRNLHTETKVVVLHFSPILDTVLGEPEFIYPFLGSSRLLQPLDTLGATVIFHGHAHHGTPSGVTPAGIPVHNVSLPLLQQAGHQFLLFTIPAPDRRRTSEARDIQPTPRKVEERTPLHVAQP
jgi:Icc-related predicted phosphoesterase